MGQFPSCLRVIRVTDAGRTAFRPSLPRVLPSSGHQPCGQMLSQVHDCGLQPDRTGFAEPLPAPGLQHEMPGDPAFPWWPRWVFQLALCLGVEGRQVGRALCQLSLFLFHRAAPGPCQPPPAPAFPCSGYLPCLFLLDHEQSLPVLGLLVPWPVPPCGPRGSAGKQLNLSPPGPQLTEAGLSCIVVNGAWKKAFWNSSFQRQGLLMGLGMQASQKGGDSGG